MARKIHPIVTIAILISFVAAFFSGTVQADIIYVDIDAVGANNGLSWINAYNHLQDALTAAVAGDEIRIAQGTYKPDQGAAVTSGDRTAVFQLIDGVTIKGGYAGFGEPEPNSRDIELYETILTGDLAGNDGNNFANNAENSYYVVNGSGTDATAVLDGVTITAGNANGAGAYGYGSGVYNDHGNPTMTDCTISENWARLGGGIYDINSNPTLSNCIFSGNLPDGMDNYDSSPILTNCTFTDNLKGVLNNNSSPTLTDCNFAGNERGMYNEQSSPTLANCNFTSNNGAMSNWAGSSPVLTNCTFTQNTADTYGGGVYNEYANPVMTDCTFTSNSANYGGAVYNYYSNPTLNNCKFTDNSTLSHSGAMRNFNSNAVLTNCTFNSNSATDDAGAMGNSQSTLMLTNCTFTANSGREGGAILNSSTDATFTTCTFRNNLASAGGGALVSFGGSATLLSCLFSGNWADGGFSGGGAVLIDGGMVTLTNCTVVGNGTGKTTGGILNDGNILILTNSILWNNMDEDGIDQEAQIWPDGTIDVNYSCILGGWSGVGNISDDPLFVSPGYWDAAGHWVDGDYHLLTGSPCLDAGDPAYVPAPGETDLDGQPRVIGNRIDMGAYEHSSAVSIDVGITPGVINLKSQGNWVTTILSFPEGYSVYEVDTESVFIQVVIRPRVWVWFDEENREIMVRFSREDVQTILSPGIVELTITGNFTDGTPFDGTGIVKVINKGGGKPPK